MLKISDFSRLSHVSVTALRYYDEIGLLKPVQVDRFTSYRHYSPDQLPRLNRILALKDLGFSLEQIARMLDEGLSPGQLRGMLRMKQAEVQQRVQEEQARLARVEARLRLIELEGKMPDYEVILKNVEPLRVLGVRDVIPTYSDVPQLHDEMSAYLTRHGVDLATAYPCLSIYYDDEEGIDAEAAVGSDGSLPGNERLRVHELPAVETMACLIHQGPYDGLSESYDALIQWIKENGYRIVGPAREVYLQGHSQGSEPSSFVTEIQFPVEKG